MFAVARLLSRAQRSIDAARDECMQFGTALLEDQGTRPQAAKIPMLAVTPTEVIEAMHHCMPNES